MTDQDMIIEAHRHVVLFREDDWMVSHQDSTQSDPSHPLIYHWCQDIWSYAFSTEYAMKAFGGFSLYKCSRCEKRAPDHIITIHRMVIK
jgi:hypothetical protein